MGAAVEPGIATSADHTEGLSTGARYRVIRATTLAICDPLETEDFVAQSMPDASPLKWHLAHTTWFFEQFILKSRAQDYRPFRDGYEYLFNSYYQAVGPMHRAAGTGFIDATHCRGSPALSRSRGPGDAGAARVARSRRGARRACDSRSQSRAAASGVDADGSETPLCTESVAPRVPCARCSARPHIDRPDAFYRAGRRYPRNRRHRTVFLFRQRNAATSRAGGALFACGPTRHER